MLPTAFKADPSCLDKESVRLEKARRVLTQAVNAMSAKMEIGGPMACAYLLGHNDHYTSHIFKPFYWRSFVNQVKQDWIDDNINSPTVPVQTPKTPIQKNQNKYITVSVVQDYMYRPPKYSDMCLYDWFVKYKKTVRKGMKEKLRKADGDTKQMFNEDDEMNLLEQIESDNGNIGEDVHETSDEVMGEDVDSEPYNDEQPVECADSDSEDTLCDDSLSMVDPVVSSDVDELDLLDNTQATCVADESVDQRVDWFLQEHPQCLTHKVTVGKARTLPIPNFVGPLPRKDGVDKNDYYITMLTFFKLVGKTADAQHSIYDSFFFFPWDDISGSQL